MPHIDAVDFGKIIIDGIDYSQVLIITDSVLERDYKKLEKLFGTSHQIGDWEIEALFKNKPETIIIGTGVNGMLEVSDVIFKKAKEVKVEIVIINTPAAKEIYNERIKAGKRVNALIHTTC